MMENKWVKVNLESVLDLCLKEEWLPKVAIVTDINIEYPNPPYKYRGALGFQSKDLTQNGHLTITYREPKKNKGERKRS